MPALFVSRFSLSLQSGSLRLIRLPRDQTTQASRVHTNGTTPDAKSNKDWHPLHSPSQEAPPRRPIIPTRTAQSALGPCLLFLPNRLLDTRLSSHFAIFNLARGPSAFFPLSPANQVPNEITRSSGRASDSPNDSGNSSPPTATTLHYARYSDPSERTRASPSTAQIVIRPHFVFFAGARHTHTLIPSKARKAQPSFLALRL